MKLKEYTEIIATLLVVVLLIGGTFFWWLPQKWTACGKLYNNFPAKVICLANND